MRAISFGSRLLVIGAAALLPTSCHGVGSPATPAGALPFTNQQRARAAAQPLKKAKGIDKIDHIVIIIQENRSFNNLFNGYPGAATTKVGHISTGAKVTLQPVTLATTWDLQHNAEGFFVSCHGTGTIPGTDCKMNGFDKEKWYCGQANEPKCPDKYPPYSYVPQDQVQPYFDMASQYVLADQMYASDFDISSFISHQYIIDAVNPQNSVNYPATAWGCPGGPPDKIDVLKPNRKLDLTGETACFNPTTLGHELDKANVSWAFYASPVKGVPGQPNCGSTDGPDVSKGRAGIWSAYQAVKSICYGPDWDKDVISPSSQVLTDVKAGNLRSVTWVTPTYSNSDHGGNGSLTGPSWVSSVVNAIGESKFWDSTAIFIFWDDPGGWYDEEPPKYLDNDGLGYRLPLLIISPYALKGVVSHEPYEHGSILKFIEDRFGLKPMAASDSRANSPADYAFNFAKPPRAFTPIKSKYDTDFFLHQAPDTRPPDDN
jgi:phospholipase C